MNDSEIRIRTYRFVFKIPTHIPDEQVDKYVTILSFNHKDNWTPYLVDRAVDRELTREMKNGSSR